VGISRDFQIYGVPPIISGTHKTTNLKFRRCIQSVHVNKSPLIIWEKRDRGRIQVLPKFFEYPLLSQERVKLQTSNFVGTFILIDQNKSLGPKSIKKFGKSSRQVVKIFQGTHM